MEVTTLGHLSTLGLSKQVLQYSDVHSNISNWLITLFTYVSERPFTVNHCGRPKSCIFNKKSAQYSKDLRTCPRKQLTLIRSEWTGRELYLSSSKINYQFCFSSNNNVSNKIRLIHGLLDNNIRRFFPIVHEEDTLQLSDHKGHVDHRRPSHESWRGFSLWCQKVLKKEFYYIGFIPQGQRLPNHFNFGRVNMLQRPGSNCKKMKHLVSFLSLVHIGKKSRGSTALVETPSKSRGWDLSNKLINQFG